MKKFLSVLIMILLVFGIFVFVGCNDKIKEPVMENTNQTTPGTDPGATEPSANTDTTPSTPSTPSTNPGDGGAAAKEPVTIVGTVGGKAVVNPIFNWENKGNDNSFSVTIKSSRGTSVASGDASAAHYEVSGALEYGKSFVFTAKGKDSGTVYEVSFDTVAGSGTLNINSATITVNEPVKSHMVIQRGKPIVIKGTTKANLLVSMDFYGTTYYTVSDEAGAFAFEFPAKEANATPQDLEIRLTRGKKLTISDVLIGDVFLVSGQSNVQRTLAECPGEDANNPEWEQDVADATTYNVRYYYQAENTSITPVDTTKNAVWSSVASSGTNYKQYSAVAFMVGAMVGKGVASDGVPVGILYAAKGDTNIANWMSKEYYDGSVGTKNLHYNGMIYPLRNAEIKGVVWYQGCNNSAKGTDYEGQLTSLIANWRELFGNEKLPFYVVQLPCYNGDSGNNYDFSFVRESQLNVCQADANAYLIATCDGGEPGDIHPKAKRYIAERVAKSILSTLYGAPYLPQGPTYKSHVVQGSSVVITVDNGEGLTAEGAIVGFMLAGADGKYFDATATISEGKITVTSEKVAAPVYVKYGFSKCPFLNVYNKDGFLMSPFRTDVHNRNIDLLDYREDAVYTSNASGSVMEHRVVEVDGEIGLEVTKPADDKGYGILELAKWGAIGYDELDIELSLIGTNSGAELLFRIVEGGGEIWAIGMTDNFVGKRTVTVPTSAFQCAYNSQDGVIDYQKVMQVDLVVKKAGTATVTVLGVKFVTTPRTAPRAFAISEARNDGHEVSVKYAKSGFANNYRVIVSADGANFANPVYDQVTDGLQASFDPALLSKDVIYYAKVVAINELGETVATNSGIVVASLDRLVVESLVFEDDESFNAFAAAKLKVKSCLQASRDDKGLKINVKQKDNDYWSYCILTFTEGANRGYNTLKVHLDLREFAGDKIVIQLQNAGGDTSYSYTISTKSEGNYEIPLSSFKKDGVAFDGRDIGKIAFNIVDYTSGGASDNVYIRDIEFLNK